MRPKPRKCVLDWPMSDGFASSLAYDPYFLDQNKGLRPSCAGTSWIK